MCKCKSEFCESCVSPKEEKIASGAHASVKRGRHSSVLAGILERQEKGSHSKL